jgi:hypothetical protein
VLNTDEINKMYEKNVAFMDKSQRSAAAALYRRVMIMDMEEGSIECY